MVTRDQLVLELAAQFYINKDRVTVGWGIPDDNASTKDFPDPNRQWHVYRDEWISLSDSSKQVWIDKAEDWLSTWSEKNEHMYSFLLDHGLNVFGSL